MCEFLCKTVLLIRAYYSHTVPKSYASLENFRHPTSSLGGHADSSAFVQHIEVIPKPTRKPKRGSTEATVRSKGSVRASMSVQGRVLGGTQLQVGSKVGCLYYRLSSMLMTDHGPPRTMTSGSQKGERQVRSDLNYGNPPLHQPETLSALMQSSWHISRL